MQGQPCLMCAGVGPLAASSDPLFCCCAILWVPGPWCSLVCLMSLLTPFAGCLLCFKVKKAAGK